MVDPTTFTVVLDKRGRLVIPAGLRASLGLSTGDVLVLTDRGDGTVLLASRRALAALYRGAFPQPGRPSAVDELIAERRAEAARESAER